MPDVKRLVLDVLKPHQPDNLEFSKRLAALGEDYKITLTVQEMDEKTETLELQIEGQGVDFDRVREEITRMGASLHSIDEVEVVSVEPGDESV